MPRALARGNSRQYEGKILFERRFEEIQRIKGIGLSRAATLLAAGELAKRYLGNADGLPSITTSIMLEMGVLYE